MAGSAFFYDKALLHSYITTMEIIRSQSISLHTVGQWKRDKQPANLHDSGDLFCLQALAKDSGSN